MYEPWIPSGIVTSRWVLTSLSALFISSCAWKIENCPSVETKRCRFASRIANKNFTVTRAEWSGYAGAVKGIRGRWAQFNNSCAKRDDVDDDARGRHRVQARSRGRCRGSIVNKTRNLNSLTGWQRLKEPKSSVSQHVGGRCVCVCACSRGCKWQSGFHFPTACYRWQHERRHAKEKQQRKAGRRWHQRGGMERGVVGFQQRMCVWFLLRNFSCFVFIVYLTVSSLSRRFSTGKNRLQCQQLCSALCHNLLLLCQGFVRVKGDWSMPSL